MAPSIISKINTGVQITLVVVVLLISLISGLEIIITPLVYIVFATTVLSGIDYVWIWSKKAWLNRSQ